MRVHNPEVSVGERQEPASDSLSKCRCSGGRAGIVCVLIDHKRVEKAN